MRSPSFFFASCVFISTFLVALVQSVPLVPFKNAPTVLARSTWKREVVPKHIVTLSYSPERSHRPTSSLTFAAHPNLPILLLENIEFLVDTVACYASSETDDSVVQITFNSEDAYAATLAAWSSLSQFMLVTSHPSCNPSDQRGAWLVSSVSGETFDSTIALQVQTVPLREAGSSFRISHAATGVSTAWGTLRAKSLIGRDAIDKIFPLDETFDFAPRQQLLPIDTSLGNNTLLASLSDEITDPDGMQVFCVDCVSVSKFSVGLEINVTGLSVSQAWINVTVDDFQHDIQLEFSLSDTVSYQKNLDVLLLAIPDLGFSLSDVVTMGFFYGAAVRVDLDLSGELNFTVGASASIPKDAEATFMITQFNASSAVGWDQSTFDVHPFRLNSGSFNATAGLSLSPFLEATLHLTSLVSATARLYVNTPHVTGAARLEQNVTRDCQPLGANDFEYFSEALTFGAGLNLSVDATASGALLPDDDDDSDGDDNDTPFFTHALPFGDMPTLADPKCMIVVDDLSTASLAGQVVAPTGTLLAAATAIPSFDVAGIQSYYSANGALPTNVNYGQMLQATTVPDDIKKAVEKAGALGLHARLSVVVSAAVAVGGAMVLFL
ncbi:hypothetical protein FB451DRAFT_1280774 [Mycena latifolia]|nr:hypothetical protein FB451DRAFT_1280774 [Mycena latifolia]